MGETKMAQHRPNFYYNTGSFLKGVDAAKIPRTDYGPASRCDFPRLSEEAPDIKSVLFTQKR